MRIAIVGLLHSEERDKLALIADGIRRAGHVPVLADATRFRRTPGGIVGGPVPSVITGRHRLRDGSARVVTAGVLSAETVSRVDAVWPEALDIGRRLEFRSLYADLSGLATLAGPWESVLTATFKHRTRVVLAAAGLPQPRWEIVRAGCDRAWDRDVWVKAPDDSHGRGVFWVPAGHGVGEAVRCALRDTPDGELCLVEEDVRGWVAGHRADWASTVLDGRVLHSTLRSQAAAGLPSNSGQGGRSVAAVAPAGVADLAVATLAAIGCRYGSVDVFGGGPYVVGEVNVMPGGRSPGFVSQVIDPLVTAYVREVRETAGEPAAGGRRWGHG